MTNGGNLDPSLLPLFRQEAANHTEALSYSLLEWEHDTSDISKKLNLSCAPLTH